MISTAPCTYQHKEEVELDGVIAVHVLVREEELLPESEQRSLLYALLSQALVRVQPVHWGSGWKGEKEKREERRAWRANLRYRYQVLSSIFF